MLLYYITGRRQLRGDAQEQQQRLLEKIGECAAAGVDYIQLREKDLGAGALEELAHKAMAAIAGSRSRLLINARTDVALACGAHGVHLPAHDLPASEARAVFSRAKVKKAVIAVSAHSAEEMARAESHGADFMVFAPVFEKAGAANAAGLETLQHISRRATRMPVLALGGVALENAQLCLEAGAAGIAGIRLFQENEAARIVKELKSL